MNAEKYSQSMFNDEEEQSRARAGGAHSTLKKAGGKKSRDNRKNTATEGSRRVKKEKKKKEKAEETANGGAAVAPLSECHPVVLDWVQRALDQGVANLREEFRSQLAKYTRPDMTLENFNKNSNPDVSQSKNRYQDVPCQDQSAVPLSSPPAPCAYVHANYVGTQANDKRFICTQGPLDHTVEDFWWLVVQQKVEQIVMLCKTVEMGKFKCAQYWPATMGEKKEFKSIVIENVSGTKPMERDGEIQITMLNVTVDGQTMSVRHLHWTEWPDRGVPPVRLTGLELLSSVRGSKAPIVVHCSAGIGRTGTIVAIEYILEKISTNDKSPMPDLVKQIRNQRAYSIQNDLQYLYIHRVMLSYFMERYKNKYGAILTINGNDTKYNTFLADYNVAVGQS